MEIAWAQWTSSCPLQTCPHRHLPMLDLWKFPQRLRYIGRVGVWTATGNCRKNMAQFFQVEWKILFTLTSPPEWGGALGCGGSEDKGRSREFLCGQHQVKTAWKTGTWCSNPGTQKVEAGGQQAPDQPYSYKVRQCLKK